MIMSTYLLVDPDKLYRLYNYKDIQEYYHFDFFADFSSIEVDIFYDILNSISKKQLSNLNMYIFKQWSLARKKIDISDLPKTQRKKDILQRQYLPDSIQSKDKFNTTLTDFIQGDHILSLYIMNQCLKFLYPC
jgi:hypothetical protein